MSYNWETLLFDRVLIKQGELWRLITGHLIHLNYTHLLMNIAGLLFILLINSTLLFNPRRLLLSLCLSLWVSFLLWFLNPEILRYGGLSGILHGLFVIAVAWQDRYSNQWKVLLISGAVGKVICEQTGLYDTTSLSVDIGGRVAIDAHMYGLLGGLLIIAASALLNQFKSKKEIFN